MLTLMPLTPEQRDRYRNDGYLLVRALIDPETLAALDQRFCAIAMRAVPTPDGMRIMDDVAYAKGGQQPASPLHAVNKILSFENDPVLWPFATDPRLLAVVRDLIGREIQTLSTNLFNKPPGVDGRHPLHQDLRYFALRPADKIVGTWTAIGPCNRGNGCVAVVPGSHLGELAEHAEPDWELVNFGFFAARGADVDARVHVEMQPGDTLLFHPLLVHGSGHNRSADFRRAISVHYASLECRRPESLRGRRPRTRRIGATTRRIPSA